MDSKVNYRNVKGLEGKTLREFAEHFELPLKVGNCSLNIRTTDKIVAIRIKKGWGERIALLTEHNMFVQYKPYTQSFNTLMCREITKIDWFNIKPASE